VHLFRTTTKAEYKRDVLLGLDSQLKDKDGFYELFTLKIKGNGASKHLAASIDK
jgi:hypothetical protein